MEKWISMEYLAKSGWTRNNGFKDHRVPTSCPSLDTLTLSQHLRGVRCKPIRVLLDWVPRQVNQSQREIGTVYFISSKFSSQELDSRPKGEKSVSNEGKGTLKQLIWSDASEGALKHCSVSTSGPSPPTPSCSCYYEGENNVDFWGNIWRR